MKFLIPGGAGYIGVHISCMLLQNGHDVVIIDNLSNSGIDSIKSLESLANKKVTFYEGNICDQSILIKIY